MTEEQRLRRNAHAREYYQRPENVARRKELSKIRYDANREEKRAYARAYAAAHPEQRQAYRDAHREQMKKYSKELYQANRESIRAYHASPERKAHRKNYLLSKMYGISKVEFDAMLIQQGGRCAICKTKEFNGYGPVVDHDHMTGKVRGILCNNCNAMLGWSRELISTLSAAIEYLRAANTFLEKDMPAGLRKIVAQEDCHETN